MAAAVAALATAMAVAAAVAATIELCYAGVSCFLWPCGAHGTVSAPVEQGCSVPAGHADSHGQFDGEWLLLLRLGPSLIAARARLGRLLRPTVLPPAVPPVPSAVPSWHVG